MAARETASNCPSRYGCVGLAESLRQRLPDAHQPNFAGGNGKPAVAFEATEEIARRVQASLARQPQPARVSYRVKRIRFATRLKSKTPDTWPSVSTFSARSCVGRVPPVASFARAFLCAKVFS